MIMIRTIKVLCLCLTCQLPLLQIKAIASTVTDTVWMVIWVQLCRWVARCCFASEKKLHLSRWSLFEHSTDTWNFMALTTLCTREDRDNGIGFARESKAFNYFGIWYKRETVFIIGLCLRASTNFFFNFFLTHFCFFAIHVILFNFVSIIQKLFDFFW